ncbi:MAG: hypothetical protein ABI002_13135 [Saprospiraceae bacterium]
MNKNNLKQVRQGYFNAKGILKKQVAKTFSLKSAQDAATRKAKDSQMFGIESLEEGQTFIFSVRFQNEEFVDLVTNALLGNQRVGKSRSAEFGQVQIKPITSPNLTGLVENKEDVIVFAQSNLCILDNHGNPSFQPSPEDLGVIGGAIDWSKSQIRTYSYSPWNGKRSSTSTQRDCIAMGSVIYIKGGKSTGNLQVGAYNSEGLGRILHNPNFLLEHGVQGNSDFLKIPPQNAGSNAKSNNNNTPLSTFLSKKKVQLEKDLELSKSVSNAVRSSNFKQKIPPSQWGSIRSLATNEPDGEKLYEKLFKENSTDRQQDGYLVKGVAAKRYWDKNRSRETLKSILTGNNNGGTKEVILSSQFVAKYAAEMAKKHKNSKNEK